MATFNLSEITNALTNSTETGVSFQGRAQKWENADQGKNLI